jgi:acetyltransferase-like isoleucine patch superfamily enzyme/acyl carrier protein
MMWSDITGARRKTLPEIGSALDSFARARWMLRHTSQGKRVRCYGRVLVEGGRGIVVSDRVVFLKGMLPTELRCAAGAELVIGPRTLFNYGVSIVAQRAVRIGARCRFGSLVQIRDDDGRRAAPVVLGDDVWVAHGALIEPGVVIGTGAVVAAGAVVSQSVPPHMLAFGNPARIFPLENTERGPSVETRATEIPQSATRARTNGAAPAGAVDGADKGESPAIRPGAAPSRAEVRAAIMEWLDDTRHFGEAESLVTSDAMSLREGGLLDSLGLVELVLMLEARFGITLDRDLVTRQENQSINALIDLVTAPPHSTTSP